MKVFPIRFLSKGSFIEDSYFMIINSNISYHRQFVKILTCERTCKEVSQNYLTLTERTVETISLLTWNFP